MQSHISGLRGMSRGSMVDIVTAAIGPDVDSDAVDAVGGFGSLMESPELGGGRMFGLSIRIQKSGGPTYGCCQVGVQSFSFGVKEFGPFSVKSSLSLLH